MDEFQISFQNEMPFALLSASFPSLRIYRWCSSTIDYLEIFGEQRMLLEAREDLKSLAADIHSELVYENLTKDRLSIAISCRCSINNSTIRIAESRNLLWQAPARYLGGREIVKVISFNEGDFSSFYETMEKLGDARIDKKVRIQPDSLRDVYTISLSELLGDLTDKQMDYLRDAISMGLFSTPRRSKVEDVARANGVTKSTMQEHVNKARNKLLHAMEPYLNLFVHSKSGSHETFSLDREE